MKKIKIEPFIELSKAGYSQEKGREILYDRLFHVTMVLIDVFKTQSSQSNPETKKYWPAKKADHQQQMYSKTW